MALLKMKCFFSYSKPCIELSAYDKIKRYCQQYCAKVFNAKFDEFRPLFSWKFDKSSPRNFVKAPTNFASTEGKFRFAEFSSERNFTGKITAERKFALMKFRWQWKHQDGRDVMRHFVRIVACCNSLKRSLQIERSVCWWSLNLPSSKRWQKKDNEC